MSTMAQSSRTHARRPFVNPWLAVVALAAALVGLGAWVVVDRTTSSTGPESSAAQIVDDLNAAVNAGDAHAVRELYAPGAVFQVSTGDRISGLDNVVNTALIPHGVGFRIERVAPVTTEGDTAATFIKYSNKSEGVELAVFQLKDGKIVKQWIYDEGYG